MANTAELLRTAMWMLAQQPGAFFIGQGVAVDGVATFDSLSSVPMSQRLELPVIEELQLGMGIGLAIHGACLPILIYPRCDFLLRATDQLVNYLDKLPEMSAGQFIPKVIVRTRVGARTPLDPGPQHTGEYSEAFRLMLTTVHVAEVTAPDQILVTYQEALARPGSTLVFENLG